MFKWVAIAAVLLGVGLAVTGKLLIDARTDARVQYLRAEQLDGQLAALRERVNRANEVRAAGERLRQGVRDAANSTQWGAEPVPGVVLSKLCERANCKATTMQPSGD